MAVTVAASGTQSATVGTEHTLATLAGPGVYQYIVDTSNLAAQDVVELRVKGPVLASGAVVGDILGIWYGVQPADDVLKTSIPIVVDSTAGGHLCTLKQTKGTSRNFPWKVLAL